MKKIKVAAYCRISTDDQLNSLKNQTEYFEKEADKNENYEFHKIYADELSATSWKKREMFKEMLIDAGLDIDMLKKELRISVSSRHPKFSRILIKDVSRFSRNAAQGLEIVTKLREKEVHIDFVSIGLSTEKMTNDMIIGFFLLAAEYESKDRSTKVSWGQLEGAKKGVIKTADNFYGYRYHKENNSLTIIPEEAEIIRKIYELYLDGNGFRKILNYLREHSIKTRKEKDFSQQSIKRMLENPAYKGLLVRNKMDSPKIGSTVRNFAIVKDEKEWIETPNRIPAIISEEIFKQVQDMKKLKINYNANKGIHRARTEYAELVKCAKCGGNYTKNREPRNGREFYNCSKKKRFGVSQCNNLNISKSVLDKAMDSLLKKDFKLNFDKGKENIIGVIEASIKSKLIKKIDKQSSEAVALKQLEIDDLNSKKERIGDMYIDGSINKDHLNKRLLELDKKLSILSEELNELNKTNADIYNDIAEIDNTLNEIRSLECPEINTIDDIKKSIIIIVDEHPQQTNVAVAKIEFIYLNMIYKISDKFPILKGLKSFSAYW